MTKKVSIVFIVMMCLITALARGADDSPFHLSNQPAYLSDGSGESVAADTTWRLRVYGIYSQTSGTLDVGPDRAGSRHVLDLDNTLGMDLDKFTGGILLGWSFGSEKRMHLDVSYDGYYNYSGSQVVGSIVFNDKVYTAGVDSSLRFHSGALNFGYDFWKNGPLTVTGNLGVRLFDIDAKLRAQSGDASGSWEFWAPVPTLGATVRYDITPNLYVKGTANGIYLGDVGCYAELVGEVGYDLNRNVGLFAGYRLWSVRVDYNEDSLDIKNQAVYAGVEIRM